jgi:hypothetical protein
MQDPVAEGVDLAGGQIRLLGEADQFRPGHQIGCGQDDFQPGGIRLGPVTGQVAQAGGLGLSDAVLDAAETLNEGDSWYPAIESSGGIRDGAWVAEATSLVDMSHWPAGTRLILRKERPHPGAQLRFTDSDGLRVTAFITDTPTGVVPGQLAGLELRHR